MGHNRIYINDTMLQAFTDSKSGRVLVVLCICVFPQVY